MRLSQSVKIKREKKRLLTFESIKDKDNINWTHKNIVKRNPSQMINTVPVVTVINQKMSG